MFENFVESSESIQLLYSEVSMKESFEKFQELLKERNPKARISITSQTEFLQMTEKESLDVIYTVNGMKNWVLENLTILETALKSNGKLIFQQSIAKNSINERKKEWMMQFMIGGFINFQLEEQVKQPLCFPCNSDDQIIEISTSKPDFQTGETGSINRKNPIKASIMNKKWTVVADDYDENDDDEDDEIDEDDLLDEDDDTLLKKRRDDCEIGKNGKRRACKDCTCGRKDMDGSPTVSNEELKQMVSSCGNCYKGDAFRCGSCPYLGKPAFKPGMGKLVLNLDNADDI